MTYAGQLTSSKLSSNDNVSIDGITRLMNACQHDLEYDVKRTLAKRVRQLFKNVINKYIKSKNNFFIMIISSSILKLLIEKE